MRRIMFFVLCILVPGTCFAGAFDDIISTEVKKEEPAPVYTSKELFDKQLNLSTEIIHKKDISLKYLNQGLSCNGFHKAFFPNADRRNGELFNSIKSILENEYGVSKSIDDGYIKEIYYLLDVMCDIESNKFIMAYVDKVNYKQKHPETSFLDGRMDNQLKNHLSLAKTYLNSLRETGEIGKIEKMFDAYALALKVYFSDLEEYIDKKFVVAAAEETELTRAYTAFINDTTVFPQQNLQCLHTVTMVLGTVLNNTVTKRECTMVEARVHSMPCVVNDILTSIELHPVATLKHMFPLKNKTKEQIIKRIEPFRKTAAQLNKICIFTE